MTALSYQYRLAIIYFWVLLVINFNLTYDSLCHLRWYRSSIFSHLAHGLLEERTPQFKNDKPKGHFTSPGSNYVISLDSHDKLMGFRNITFPITIYGCIDTFSISLSCVTMPLSKTISFLKKSCVSSSSDFGRTNSKGFSWMLLVCPSRSCFSSRNLRP